MKLIQRLVKEYTQPLNEARAKKWTDADKFWSKNINGKAADQGEGKYDITDMWGRGPFPVKKFQDDAGGDREAFGDQNKRQHNFWKKRYDIEITGQHFDGLANNGKGAVVPLLYNRGGITRDTKVVKFSDGTKTIGYVDFDKSKHKVFISGTNQDIYDWFLGNDWKKENAKLSDNKFYKDTLGVESWRETARKNKKFPNSLKSMDVNSSEDGEFWVETEQDYMMRQKGYTHSMSPKQVKELDRTMAKQGFKWDNKAGRYPDRSGGAYVDRKGKRLDFDNYKPF